MSSVKSYLSEKILVLDCNTLAYRKGKKIQPKLPQINSTNKQNKDFEKIKEN